MAGSTNRSKTSYVVEVTKGVIPTTPVFQEMRVTSNQLAYAPSRVISSEIRADRQVSDQILVDLNNGGQVGIELSFAAHDDMIEAAFQGTWVNSPRIIVATLDTEISDVTDATAATTVTVASGLGTPFLAGMLVYTSGFTTTGNNGKLLKVVSSGSTSIVFAPTSLATEAAAIPVGARLQVVGFQFASGDLVAVTSGGNALTCTAANFVNIGFQVGDWIKIGGDTTGLLFAGTAADNGMAHVSAVTATRLSFDIVPVGWLADAGATRTMQVFKGDFVKNGVTQRGFTIERQQQDITVPIFEYFVGSQLDQLSLSYKASSIITGSFTFMGQTPTDVTLCSTTTRASGASDISPPSNSVLNATSNVKQFMFGGVAVGTPSYVLELGFDLKNNLGRETAVSILGASGIRDGEIALTGNLNVYVGDNVLLTDVLTDVVSSITLATGRADGARSRILFHVPKVKFTGDAKISGKNQSRMFTGTYAAFLDSVFGTMSCNRFWYLPASA